MAKGYTDFYSGFLGASAVATKPIGNKKYMDWEKIKGIIDKYPTSRIYAGLQEDWNNTSGLIYARGEYYDGYVYGCSTWATPIIDVDGEEIECYKDTPNEWGSGKPNWWGNGQNLLDEYDFDD